MTTWNPGRAVQRAGYDDMPGRGKATRKIRIVPD
jgi:hypothetical protein